MRGKLLRTIAVVLLLAIPVRAQERNQPPAGRDLPPGTKALRNLEYVPGGRP